MTSIPAYLSKDSALVLRQSIMHAFIAKSVADSNLKKSDKRIEL